MGPDLYLWIYLSRVILDSLISSQVPQNLYIVLPLNSKERFKD